ncbi:hypothetical protein [Shinella sp. NM-101]|uniref:hypothetical protein n=1 Tax=Shinella sp. NM-101 TaxID=2744455 RepID=UPI001F2B5295|nr:hypothetical protein [Shinella sp. NM-101]
MTRSSLEWSLVQDGMSVRLGQSLRDLAACAALTGFDALRSRLSAIDLLAVQSLDISRWFGACAEHAREIAAAPEAGLTLESISAVTSVYQAGLVAGFDGVFCFLPDHMFGDLTRDELDDILTVAIRHGEVLRSGLEARSVASALRSCADEASAGQTSRDRARLKIVASRAERHPPDIGKLLQRLVVIEPTQLVAEYPELHIRSCLQQAERIVGAVEIALDWDQQRLALAAYEAGLRQGYEGSGKPQPLDNAHGLDSKVMAAVAAAGWRHGDMVAARWRTHQQLLAIISGEDQLC